jgi:hypothetical protein
MVRNVLLVGLLGLGIFLNSCSSRDVASTMKSELDLKDYKTFAWLPSGDTLLNDFNSDPEFAIRVMDRVNRGMFNRGYKMDLKNPDLLILAHAKNNKDIVQKKLPSAYNYYQPGFYTGPWLNHYYLDYKTLDNVTGPQVRDVEYKEGTLVIDFIDPKKKEIIWRGDANQSIKKKSKFIKESVENVDDILAEFPC